MVLDVYASYVLIDLNANSNLIASCLRLLCLMIISIFCQGVFIHACQRSNCHLVALEGDTAIIDAILSPLCTKTPLLTCGIVPHATSLTNEDEHVHKVAKHSRISE